MKRFWSEVAVRGSEGGFGIALDGRPVRTPSRAALAVASAPLADAIADEWRRVGETIDPRAMPLTGLANAAIDRVGPAREAFAAGLAKYGESDLLCYRAAQPEPLAARQAAAWDPLLGWAAGRYEVHFATTTGIVHVAQPAATVTRLGAAVAARSAIELAALSPIVTVTGSLVIALALLEGAADGDTAWRASRIDEDWQAELWGRDALAAAADAAHRADFDAGVRLISLS